MNEPCAWLANNQNYDISMSCVNYTRKLCFRISMTNIDAERRLVELHEYHEVFNFGLIRILDNMKRTIEREIMLSEVEE